MNPVTPVVETPCLPSSYNSALSAAGNPALSSNDVVRGYRLETMRANAADFSKRPTNARLVGTWHLTDAYRGRTWVRLLSTNLHESSQTKIRDNPCQFVDNSPAPFRFPIGLHAVTSLWAHVWGKVRPQLRNASNEIAVIGAPPTRVFLFGFSRHAVAEHEARRFYAYVPRLQRHVRGSPHRQSNEASASVRERISRTRAFLRRPYGTTRFGSSRTSSGFCVPRAVSFHRRCDGIWLNFSSLCVEAAGTGAWLRVRDAGRRGGRRVVPSPLWPRAARDGTRALTPTNRGTFLWGGDSPPPFGGACPRPKCAQPSPRCGIMGGMKTRNKESVG